MRTRPRAMLALTAVSLLLLSLAGCGTAPMVTPSVPVGIAAQPLVRALLAYQGAGAPVRFVASDPSASDPFAIASSGSLRHYVDGGYSIIGSACARPPEVLLWHFVETFGWSDVGGMPLYEAPGADPAPLDVALSRYRGLVKDLRPPIPTTGGVSEFLREPQGFLLAPEPLASALIANGQALLAQALPDELGPFPGCFVLGRKSVLRQDPLLAVRLLQTLNLGLFELRIAPTEELALTLREVWPTTTYRGIERALAVARRSGVWPDSTYLGASALSSELVDLGQSLPRGSLSDGYARQALEHPFTP